MMTLEEMAYVQKLEAENRKLKAVIVKMEARIAELERRLGMDSSNSSKPPSTDGFKKKNRSLRKPSGKKPGGQTGHKGATLELPCSPTETISCTPKQCSNCSSFGQCQGKPIETRYEIDTELKVHVREYLKMEYVCPKSNRLLRGEFPENITATKQYGNSLKGLVISLGVDCAVSVIKIHKLLKSLLHLPVSTGFIYRVMEQYADQLKPQEESIISHLFQAPILHGDETGCRADKKLAWVHSVSTSLFTYQYVHEKRGRDGMAAAGFLPYYDGILIHDCWAPYWSFPSLTHGLCLAHILRELKGIYDNDETQGWTQNMEHLLLQMKSVKENLLAKGKECASNYYKRKFLKSWRLYIWVAKMKNPMKEVEKGYFRKNKARCLADRLETHTEEFLRFFYDFRVPFDNNQAERDVRPFKVKLKMAGCFRTLKGAQIYARIHSVLSTIKKHGLNVYENVVAMLDNPSYIPWEPAGE